MNSSTCQVDQVRFRYREVGTNSYSTKTMGVPTGSGCNTTNTSKLVLNLTPNTQYEYDFKIWYCNHLVLANGGTFTTAPECDNVINVTNYEQYYKDNILLGYCIYVFIRKITVQRECAGSWNSLILEDSEYSHH